MQLISFLKIKKRIPNCQTSLHGQKNTTCTYGFIGKQESFLGISRSRILQSPLTLNASSLEGIYKLLEYSDTGAIVLPRYSLSGNGTLRYEAFNPLHNEGDNNQRNISNPLNFVFDNFPKSYPVENYTVLNVPPLSAPSSGRSTQIGLVHDPNVLSSLSKFVNYANATTTLPYSDEVYTGLNDNKKFMKVQRDRIGDEILTLNGDERGRTLWSGSLNLRKPDVNYIETKLRFIEENKARSDFGIKFQDDNSDNEYYVPIVNNTSALELRQRLISQDNNSDENKDIKDIRDLCTISESGTYSKTKWVVYIKDSDSERYN